MPSLAAVKADFARHAVYGYVICSFFLPVMQGKPADSPSDNEFITVEGITDKLEQGRALGRMFAEQGGEAGDDTLADLLLEFVERDLIGI